MTMFMAEPIRIPRSVSTAAVTTNGDPSTPTKMTASRPMAQNGRLFLTGATVEESFRSHDEDDDQEHETEHVLVAGGDVAAAQLLDHAEQEPHYEGAVDGPDAGEDDDDERVEGDR